MIEFVLIWYIEIVNLFLKKIEVKILFSFEYKYMVMMYMEEKGMVIYVKGVLEVLLVKLIFFYLE